LKPFDHQLLDLKLRPSANQMHEHAGKCWGRAQEEVKKLGNRARLLPSFIDCQIDALRSYLEEVDRCAREVHLLEEESISPLFIRQILVPRLFSTIAVRKGTIQHNLGLYGRRAGADVSAATHHLVHQINKLHDECSTRCEVEARALEKPRAPERASRAPRPPSEVGGRMVSYPMTRSLQLPLEPPMYFDRDLWVKASVILIEARSKYHEQPELLEFCKAVVSQMTPAFQEAVATGRIKASAMLGDSGMGGLLHSILIHNDDGPKSGFPGLSNRAYEVKQKVLQSSEWLTFAKAIDEASQPERGSQLHSLIDVSLGDKELHRLGIPNLQFHRLQNVAVEVMPVRLAEWERRLSQLREADPDWKPSDPHRSIEADRIRAQAEAAVKQLRTALALRGKLPGSDASPQKPANAKAINRRSNVESLLKKQGLSILDWAKAAKVDFHTANSYLRGLRNPYASTRKKLADALNIDVNELPS
jgi:hypothetical protein